MTLTRGYRKEIIERAHRDPVFRMELLKELLREAIKNDPDLLEKTVEKLDAKKTKRK